MNDQNFADMGPLAAPMLPTDDFARAWWDLNDIGNAQRFVSRNRGRFLYVRAHGWFGYDGKAWVRDGAQARALLAAEQTACAIKDEAKALFDAAKRFSAELEAKKADMYNERGALVKEWAETSGGVSRLNAMLTLAAAKLETPLDAFDADPLALNCQNGTLRFVKVAGGVKGDPGERYVARLDPHDPSDLISRVCAFEWKQGAASALWNAHLDRCIPDGREQRFLARMLGYCALGLTNEQVFFLVQGRGGDGKSVTINTARRVLGSYAANADVKTFLEDKTGRSGAQASPDLARLAGACRMVSTSEPPRGARLNEGLIKLVTGGAPLVARHLNQEGFEFKPRFKLVIEVNNRPGISGSDDGIWRRVIMMLWRVQFKKEEMIGGIEDRMVEEAGAAVLAWIVTGALAYLDMGLAAPETIEAARADYKRGANPFREWLDLHTEPDTDAVELMASLLGSYKSFMEAQGADERHIMSQKSFGLALSDHQIMMAGRESGTGKARRRGARLLSSAEVAARLAAADARSPSPCLTKAPDSSQSAVIAAAGSPIDAEDWRYEGD